MENEIKIVAIGDSIIKGAGAENDQGWIYILTLELTKVFPQIHLINKGLGGDTSIGVQKRLRKDCLIYKPDFVVLGMGVNDCRRRGLLKLPEIKISRFTKALQRISYDLNKHSKSKVLVSGMVPVDKRGAKYKPGKSYYRQDQLAYETVLKEFAQYNKFTYLNHFRHWLDKGEEFITSSLVEGVHPNEKGHAEMAGFALPFFLEELRNLPTN